jgi:hypothetical protein
MGAMAEATQQTLRRTARATGKDVTLWYRRDIFSATGWAALFVILMTALMGFVRYLFPRVLFEPPTTFKAGSPEEYAPGVGTRSSKRTGASGSSAPTMGRRTAKHGDGRET